MRQPPSPIIYPHADGFSLMELIVVTGILMFIIGGTVASYSSFNSREKVKQVALSLKSNIRLAQSKAVSGVKPAVQNPTGSTDCQQLLGYTLTFAAGNSRYTIAANCMHSDGSQGSTGMIQTVNVAGGVKIIPKTSILTFHPLAGGIKEYQVITISSANNAYQVIVNPSGEVDDLGFCNAPTGDPLLCPTPTPTPTSTPTPTPSA